MEYPTTNLNENLIGAGLNTSQPQNTYVDFATQLAKNSMDQKQMEENLAKAKLMTKQAQIQTSQSEAANEAGYNPQLANTMTKDQAIAQAKLIFAQKGTEVDEATIDQWAATLPPVVQASQIEEFASRFARETNRLGKDFVATAADAKGDKQDENGDPLVKGQTYAALYNNQGDIQSYVRSGQEKSDNSLALGEKSDQFWQREWDKIAKSANPYTASSRNSLGVAMQSYVRAVRAIEALQDPKITKQKAAQVIAEIDAIYKGGSPDQTTLEMTLYPTLYGKLHDWMQSIRGKVQNYVPENIREYLLTQIEELNQRSKQIVEGFIQSTETLNQQVIEHFPDEWNKFKTQFLQQLEHPEKDVMADIDKGNKSTVTPAATSMTTPAPTGKKVPKYTVEE